MRRLAIALAATIFAACSFGGGEETTPTVGPTATNTPVAEAIGTPDVFIPNSGYSGPPPTELPPGPDMLLPTADPKGELAPYTAEVGWVQTGARTFPIMEVRAHDLGSGTTWAYFRYGGKDQYPLEADLGTGRTVVFSTERYVEIRSLETGQSRRVYEAPEGSQVSGMAVSHSRTMVAVAVSPLPVINYDEGEMRVLDISSGTEAPQGDAVVRVFAKAGAPLSGSYFANPQWLAGDVGMMVVGAVQREGPGGRATLFMDGTMRAEKPEWRVTSPEGRYAWSSGATPCFAGMERDDLVLLDAVWGEPLATYRRDSGYVQAWEWAPDSSAVLFAQYQDVVSGCSGEPAHEYGLLPVDGSPPTIGVAPEAVRRQWAGSVLFELSCADGGGIARADGGRARCEYLEQRGDLRIAGRDGGRAIGITTLGLTR